MPAKRHNRYKRLSRVQKAFNNVAETLDYIFNFSMERRPMLQTFDDYQQWKMYQEWKNHRKQLNYLKRTQLIEARRVGERLLVKLTEKGYRKMLQAQLRGSQRKCTEGVCLVSFDIPESQKVVRNSFRRLLRDCGFKKLHHSVWYTENDVREPLLAFVKMNKLAPWVHIFVGKIVTASQGTICIKN
jgi:hypothetical protein